MANHYEVVLTPGAEQDLEAIIGYIAEHDCPANAERVLDQLSEVLASLEHMPERGSIPKELLALGIGSVRISVCEAVGLFSVTVRRPLTVLPVPAR